MKSLLTLSRRSVLFGSGSTLLLRGQSRSTTSPFLRVKEAPDSATAFTETEPLVLLKNGSSNWRNTDVELSTVSAERELTVKLRSPRFALLRVHLRWQLIPAGNLQYLGDHWERSYGDLGWRSMEPERILPWYFLATDGVSTSACGVKTAPSAFCFWQVDPAGVSLWLDVRNGGRGVDLGSREITLAHVVAESYQEAPFAAAKQFCARLCAKPRLPASPVYGGNNWYYAYGKSSAQDIHNDSERIADLASSTRNRPFMVIDDGWAQNTTAGPWTEGNSRFPDMPQLAATMRKIGVQPGIWMRPLFTKEQVPETWRLQSPSAQHEYSQRQAYTLDPTVPDVSAKIEADIRTIVQWNYGLIKHDFSTYDLLGRWGFAMNAVLTDPNWQFSDRSLTNAEIILAFYQKLREAAGEAILLGCNTVGHLSAGLFELQRIGDDTSGRDWNRTRKMGVNTLAFRAPQHNTFFAIDADCVGMTKQIPWKWTRQWLDLLARSGTPLFVSAAPDAIGPDEKTALKKAFVAASTVQPLAEPLDWLRNNEPEQWKIQNTLIKYDWFSTTGTSPFAG